MRSRKGIVLLFLFLFLQDILPQTIESTPKGTAQSTEAKKAASSESDEDYGDEYDKENAKIEIADPLKKFNKCMYVFNDRLYLWVVNPVAKGYAKIVPEKARVCVMNFFNNLYSPIYLVNSLLQGKFSKSGKVLSRFCINTTLGFLGLFDPAKNEFKIDFVDSDFGLTLGNYGVKNGMYLVLPFFGPSTLRDGTGMLFDYFLNPLRFLETNEMYVASSYKAVNTVSLHLGDYETIKNSAIDPYESFKNIYLQHREDELKKG